MQALNSLEPLARQRLFAVVHMFGRQRKITNGDLLLIESHLPLQCGQKLLLTKCLVLGGKDFSIIGRPLVDKELFRIDATVVEKTMSDHKCFYYSKPRNFGLKKFFFQSLPQTVLRINNIELKKLPECYLGEENQSLKAEL